MIQGVPNSVRISENTSLKPHQMVVPNSMLDEIVESTRGKGFEIMSGNDSAVHLPSAMYNALVEKTEQAGQDTI